MRKLKIEDIDESGLVSKVEVEFPDDCVTLTEYLNAYKAFLNLITFHVKDLIPEHED